MVKIDENLFQLLITGPALLALLVGWRFGHIWKKPEPQINGWDIALGLLVAVSLIMLVVAVVGAIGVGFAEGVSS